MNYNDINDVLKLLYAYVYKESDPKKISCAEVHTIVKKNITPDDLKKPLSFDFTDIFANKQIEFLSNNNDKWHFKMINDKSYNYKLSIGKYSSMNTNNLNKKELYNIALLYICSEYILRKSFNHTVMPIMMFDITYGYLRKIPEISNVLEHESDDTKMYGLITEHYHEMDFLSNYIKIKNLGVIEWKVIIFQILYALSKLNDIFGKFRHNKLDLDSISVYHKNPDNEHDIYVLNKVEYKIPHVGIECKINDFSYSMADNYINNVDCISLKKDTCSRLSSINCCDDTLDLDYVEGVFRDIHYFLNHVYLIQSLPLNVKKFIEEIIPVEFLAKSTKNFSGLDIYKFTTNNYKLLVPTDIVNKNNFFSEFIMSNSDSDMTPVNNSGMKVRNSNSESRMMAKVKKTSKKESSSSEEDTESAMKKKKHVKKSKESKGKKKRSSNDSETSIIDMKTDSDSENSNDSDRMVTVKEMRKLMKALNGKKYKMPKRIEVSSSDSDDNEGKSNYMTRQMGHMANGYSMMNPQIGVPQFAPQQQYMVQPNYHQDMPMQQPMSMQVQQPMMGMPVQQPYMMGSGEIQGGAKKEKKYKLVNVNKNNDEQFFF